MIGTEDLEKMTTLEITKKLVSLFKEYDSLRDYEKKLVSLFKEYDSLRDYEKIMLEENPNRDMWDDVTKVTYDTLLKDIVDKYDEIKSICDYVNLVFCNRLGIEV